MQSLSRAFVCFAGVHFCGMCRSESEDDGFPGIDYNDVYKIKAVLAQEAAEDLPEADTASLASLSIADADVELAGFEVASEDSVF